MDRGSRARWHALAPLSGALCVVLIFVGSAAIARTNGPGRHSLDASAGEVASYLADADPARVLTGEYVGVLGLVLFLPFSAFVAARVIAERSAWGATTARAAATGFVLLSTAAVAALAPAVNRPGGDAAAFLDLRTTLIALAFVFLAAWLIAIGWHALETGVLPRWLSWAAVAIGVLQLVGTPLSTYDPGFTGVPTFAAFLWVLVVSILLFRRERSQLAPVPA